MKAKAVIEASFTHRPHPGLHIKVTLQIDSPHAPQLKWWQKPFTLIVPVPNDIPFDEVEKWWDGSHSPAGVELFDLMKRQLPGFSRRLKQAGKTKIYTTQRGSRVVRGESPNLYLADPHIVGYVHKDGTPYDIRLFMRDRVSGILGEGHRPHPGMCVRLNIKVYPHDWQSGNDNHTIKPIIVDVPDDVAFDAIPKWVRNKESPGTFVTWWPYVEDQHHVDRETVGAIVSADLVGYVHQDGTPYDIRPFMRDRVGDLLNRESPPTH